jgi:hypothetical protein
MGTSPPRRRRHGQPRRDPGPNRQPGPHPGNPPPHEAPGSHPAPRPADLTGPRQATRQPSTVRGRRLASASSTGTVRDRGAPRVLGERRIGLIQLQWNEKSTAALAADRRPVARLLAGYGYLL